MSSESVSSNKVKTLNNKPFLLQHPNHKQKSYGALSQKLHCRRHILFHRQTRRPKIAPACRTYRLITCGLYDVQKQYPFETVAVCVLPNHIHAIWTLPPDDADYSLRWRLIKTKFSAHFPHAENLSASKQRRHERGIWQRRFYEHTVRDETDGLHPFQSRQTWIMRQCPRLGIFVVSPLCAGRMAAVRLGRHKRNGGNEFWGVNVIIKLPTACVAVPHTLLQD